MSPHPRDGRALLGHLGWGAHTHRIRPLVRIAQRRSGVVRWRVRHPQQLGPQWGIALPNCTAKATHLRMPGHCLVTLGWGHTPPFRPGGPFRPRRINFFGCFTPFQLCTSLSPPACMGCVNEPFTGQSPVGKTSQRTALRLAFFSYRLPITAFSRKDFSSNDYPKVIQRLSSGPLHAHCGLRVHKRIERL